MLIKNLEKCILKKAIKKKTTTGNIIISDYEKINDYRIQEQILQDEVTSTIYGSDVNKMKRIASPLHRLEAYLLPKVDNIEDNIKSFYKDNLEKYRAQAREEERKLGIKH
jgi:hypothetical protein